LHGFGFKTGLHISPHLLDIRERMQINDKLISQKAFIAYINKLKPFIKQTTLSKHGSPTYFEILVCLAYYIFYDVGVDYAVVETGLGGWYDATNTVDRSDKLSLITSIGLDHTHILGKTVKEIAKQKAKIITQNSIAVVQENTKVIREVIKQEARQKNAQIFYLPTSKIMSSSKITDSGLSFNYIFKGKIYKKIKSSTRALYQAENICMALAATQILSRRDKFLIAEEKIRKIVTQVRFAGRMEELQVQGKKIILDGAHNPQKMSAFFTSLKKAFPHKKIHFLVAFKKGKDIKEMMKLIEQHAFTLTITTFVLETHDLIHRSEDPYIIKSYIKKPIELEIVTNQIRAFDQVLMKTKKDQIMAITGSLYLLSMIYNHIYEYSRH